MDQSPSRGYSESHVEALKRFDENMSDDCATKTKEKSKAETEKDPEFDVANRKYIAQRLRHAVTYHRAR